MLPTVVRARTEAGSSVLTKPVFEPSLVHMLTVADERRRQEGCGQG